MHQTAPSLVIVSGMSGSGKSVALNTFEDLGFYCVDNLPAELLQDMLEVRGLGVLNIRQMFGDTAVKKNKYLRLIVHLTKPALEPQPGGIERIIGDLGVRRVLDLDVPMITLPVMPGRNLAVLTEAAARTHILRAKGVDPAAAFMARHSHFLERSSP